MTDLSQLPALIERVKALTGPDRETDARVHYALFPDTGVLLDPGDVRERRKGVRGPLHKMPIDGWDDYDGICHHIGAQRYTTSIDAAIALAERVLPGWAKGFDGGTKTNIAFLDPHDFNDRIFGARYTAEGTTPAIAILLAILTALQSEGR